MLSKVPGFRTGVLWKKIVAVVAYVCTLLLIVFSVPFQPTALDKIMITVEILFAFCLVALPVACWKSENKFLPWARKRMTAKIVATAGYFLAGLIVFTGLVQIESPQAKQMHLQQLQQAEEAKKQKELADAQAKAQQEKAQAEAAQKAAQEKAKGDAAQSSAPAGTGSNQQQIASATPVEGTNQDQFNADHPVSDQYMKDFLSFMKDYYDQLHDKVYNTGAVIDPGEWGALLGQHNREGWARYRAITYPTNLSVEPPGIFQKRTDVAQAWMNLYDLSMTYDSFLRHEGKGLNDVKKGENEFEAAYQKAMNHFN